MSALPGNPHYGNADGIVDAVVFSADGSPMQTTELLLSDLKDATLALAFEQRTATLVQLVRALADTGQRDRMEPYLHEINDRLGMTEEP